MVWIPITIAAATFQILRTSRQHLLRDRLSTNAAGFVRYAFGLPLAAVACLIVFVAVGRELPSIPGRFWPIVVLAALSQIVGTIALLASFRARDFAIGTVYAKSEVLIVAAFGAIGWGAALRPAGWAGAILVTAGVVSLAARGSWSTLARRGVDRAAGLGVLAGLGFAGAAVGIGAAAGALTGAPSFDRALFTLTAVLAVQTVTNGAWLAVAEPGALGAVTRTWRQALWVGVFSLLGSIGWAWAFTLASPAKVRTLGQVELLIAFAIARLTLGERHTRADLVASGVVLAGVVVVAAFG